MMTVLQHLAASALYGFILPLVELTYKKANQELSYSLVLEIQMVMCLFATAFCTARMLLNNDFKCFFLGGIGVVFCDSSLLSGVMVTVALPVTETLVVVFYNDKFGAEKGVALALSLWGFLSYFYGDIKQMKKKKMAPSTV
ncbi:hypothetical protein V6N13_143492 [Hibiscus sabdariffa]|uniref:Uncharacterized protein n=1 Tax=Hibiscus sabdariffa TaxID=183260 RepID=A0ABR2FHL3_9ROSI